MRTVFVKREIKIIVWIVGVVSLFLLLTACGKKNTEPEPEEKVELNFWNVFTGPDGDIMQQIVEEFNREYEGKIEVSTSVFSSESYYTTLSSAMLGGTAPDICIMHCSRIAYFAEKNQLCTLDELVDSLGYTEADFLPIAWENGTYENARYGIPMDIHQLALYYNKELLQEIGVQEIPDNLEEFIQIAQKATYDQDGDGKNDRWGFAIDPSVMSEQMFLSLLYQYGGEALSADKTQATYNCDAGNTALTLMWDMIYKYQISPKSISLDSAVTMFEEGKLLFYANGPWMLSELNEVEGLEFGVATFPQFGEQEGVWADSHNIVIPVQRSQSEEKEQAIQIFAEYLLNHELDWAKAGHVPALKSVLESTEYQEFQVMRPFYEQLDTVKILWGSPYYDDYVGTLGEYIQKVLSNDLETEEALDAAEKDAAAKIDARKEN